ncbi:nuclear transport factor 2 family protein [Actinokineospora sp. 24-640]
MSTDPVERHLAAWRDGDPDAAAAAVASFTDPDTDKPLSGHALAAHAREWLARFPGTFEFTVDGPVVSWTLTAAHRDSYLGMPGTGAELVVTGVDVLTEREDGLHVRRGFDRLAVAEALGYTAKFVPREDGDREFGVSTRTPGRPGTPGAITLTWLDVRDDDEGADVDLLSVEVVKALRASRGFLGAGTFDIGNRKYTLTAFDKPDSVRAVHARAHQRAMRRFFKGGLCTGAYTSVWTLARESHFARCGGCDTMTAAGKTCDCGWTPDPETLF